MTDLEDLIDREQALEKKRKEIARLYMKGKVKRELAEMYGMSIRGITELLKVCISYGYLSEKDYCARARENMGVLNFKRRIK
jgi:predicted nucleic acid-binding protein